MSDQDLMNTYEVARELKITPRQLDHWCRRGFVPGQERNPGSGRHREFDAEQVSVLKQMSILVLNGFVPSRAAELAASGEAAGIVAALEKKTEVAGGQPDHPTA